MQVRLALPKGRLLPQTSALLSQCGVNLVGYDESSRSYRPECRNMSNLLTKTFNEKDIPIQVAVGNYDLGICGKEWVEELLAKYPASALVQVQDLGYGCRHLWLAANTATGIDSLDDLKRDNTTIRIVTEFPNLAESFALDLRLRSFKIFPVWGRAEAYPPENADLALIANGSNGPNNHSHLVHLTSILNSCAVLIANRDAWRSRDLSCVLECFKKANKTDDLDAGTHEGSGIPLPVREQTTISPRGSEVWIALPDGHQQAPTLEFLQKAGIDVHLDANDPSRPHLSLPGVKAKMIRPQDMPVHVANGNFDLAITGEDWLHNHLSVFPSSPVRKILSFGFGTVRVVAVVSKHLDYQNLQDLRSPSRKHNHPVLRVASEYVDIADKYARDNHLSPYRLIPTWGASEAFLPEDADLLIENTQTGRTLAQHGLRIIDTLFESSACLIGRQHNDGDKGKTMQIENIVSILDGVLHET